EAHNLAGGAGVLPSGRDRGAEAGEVIVRPGHVVLDHLAVRGGGVAVLGEELLPLARDDDHRQPALPGRELGGEGEVGGDEQDAGGALGPLQVATEPEAVIGDPRDHGASFCTQVSLEPPPWLELTTYEPSRSATRDRPPGKTQGTAASAPR